MRSFCCFLYQSSSPIGLATQQTAVLFQLDFSFCCKWLYFLFHCVHQQTNWKWSRGGDIGYVSSGKGMPAFFFFMSGSFFYFFVARNKPGMFFFFLHTGLAVGHECGGWTRTWLCGLQAIVSRLLSRPSSKLLLGFIVRPQWCPSVQGLLSNFPELQCAVGWGVSKQSQLQMMLSAVQTKKENQRHEPQVKTCQVSLHCKSSLFWITHQAM